MKLRLQTLGGVRPRTVLAVLEVALVIALATQAARLTWMLATPMTPLGESPAPAGAVRPPVDLSILAQFDPFFRGAPSAAAGEGDGASGGQYVLYGVRSAGGGRGSAILAAGGGAQRFFDVGQEVEPGVTLAAVAADHVILSRGGARQRVGFPQPQPGAAVLPAVSTTPAPGPVGPEPAVLDARRLLGQMSLSPRVRDGQPAGYQVIPRGGDEMLRAAGLQRGDVLLAIDGVTLTPERVSQLPQELGAASGAELRFERGGQIMTTRIRMTPQ